jgi:chromosome segregation ATPase
MENIQENKSSGPDINVNKPKRKAPVFLIVLIVILGAVIAYLGFTYYDLKKQSEIDRTELERQKSNLEMELHEIYNQYDSLKSDNDTMNLKLLAQQQHIEKLLKVNANNVYKIQMYEKELKTIREVLKSYIYQIDSLNQANIALRTENIEVRQRLKQTEIEKQELTTQKEALTQMVVKASVLSAKNIVITPLNKRSRENVR